MSKGRKLKKKSKRFTLHHKHKVEKKVREHHRKLRRDKKRHPEKYRKRKDPGVPNSLPFKLALVNETRENMEKEKEYHHKVQKELKLREKNDKVNTVNMGQSIGDLLSDVEKRKQDYDTKLELQGNKKLLHDRSAKAYYKEFRKVVESADVLLEVLDCRDPLGTRCIPMEEFITSLPGKKLVFVLNKADLIPKENLEDWLKYLRKQRPVVPFKASTQSQHSNLSHSKSSMERGGLSQSGCVGADVLMQLLKNYCRSENIKTAICVGVIGLPNVGKSSVINSLKRSKACGTGSTPGVTRSLQEVQLDSKIRLLDCPGVIMPAQNVDDLTSCLRNAVKVQDIKDYYTPVDAILKKAGKDQIMLHYNLPAFKDTGEFLTLMAKKSGKLRKGGVSDLDAAGKKVLHDWNSGHIKYYTRPPKTDSGDVRTTLVEKLEEEFKLEELEQRQSIFFDHLPTHNPSSLMCVESMGPLMEVQYGDEKTDLTENGHDSDMEGVEDEESTEIQSELLLSENVEVNISAKPAPAEDVVEKRERWETKPKEIDLSTANLRKLRQNILKKKRKEGRRNLKRTDDLVQTINRSM